MSWDVGPQEDPRNNRRFNIDRTGEGWARGGVRVAMGAWDKPRVAFGAGVVPCVGIWEGQCVPVLDSQTGNMQ